MKYPLRSPSLPQSGASRHRARSTTLVAGIQSCPEPTIAHPCGADRCHRPSSPTKLNPSRSKHANTRSVPVALGRRRGTWDPSLLHRPILIQNSLLGQCYSGCPQCCIFCCNTSLQHHHYYDASMHSS